MAAIGLVAGTGEVAVAAWRDQARTKEVLARLGSLCYEISVMADITEVINERVAA